VKFGTAIGILIACVGIAMGATMEGTNVAVVLNVTAVNPGAPGDYRLYPADTSMPTASAINFAPGKTRANNAIVSLGTGGRVTARCDMPAGSTASAHLVVDVSGYFRAP